MSIENGNGRVDVPAEYTSSIGPADWPPKLTNNRRLKGVYGEVIDSQYQLASFFEEFSSLPFGADATRITARFIVALNVLGGLTKGSCIETIVPLTDCGISQLADCALVYVGRNLIDRRSPQEILEEQHQRALGIFYGPKTPVKPLSSGYDIRLLTSQERADSEILEMYYNLYSLFGWSQKQVSEMLRNLNNLIFAARNPDGLIVSSALAERGKMTFSRNDQTVFLSLVEITEAATLSQYRGNGLYQHVSDAVLSFLAKNDPPNLVFGELNLDAPGVLKVAARQGRIPALATAEQFRMPKVWCLEQHVVISQGDNSLRQPNYPYNNLMVAFMPQDLLVDKYGQHSIT